MRTEITNFNSRRGAQRTRVLKTAELFTSSGSIKVRVRDLTKTGARVLTDGFPSAQGDFIFQCGSIFVAARVAWCKGTERGLEFYRELLEADLPQTAPFVAREEAGMSGTGNPVSPMRSLNP